MIKPLDGHQADDDGMQAMNRSTDPDSCARTALRLIGPDPANWVPDRQGIDHNVAIIGGGQTGCALAFALRRAGIQKTSGSSGQRDLANEVWTCEARCERCSVARNLWAACERVTPHIAYEKYNSLGRKTASEPRSSL